MWSLDQRRNSNISMREVTNLKFYTSVVKGLKLKVRKFLGLIPKFVENTGEKLVVRNTTILRQLEEVIAYCLECKEVIDKYIKHLDSLSIEFFSKARKLLIQYYPINQTYKKFYWYITLE